MFPAIITLAIFTLFIHLKPRFSSNINMRPISLDEFEKLVRKDESADDEIDGAE